jgi:hypothetical protein
VSAFIYYLCILSFTDAVLRMPDSIKDNLYLQLLPEAVEVQPSEFYGNNSQLVATQVVGRGIGQLRSNMVVFDFKFSLPLILLLLLTVLFLFFRKNFSNLIAFLLSFKKFWNYRRTQEWNSVPFFLSLFLFSVFSLALFFAEVACSFMLEFSENESFAFLFFAACGASILFLLLRFFACWIIGAVANEKRLFSSIRYTQLMFFALMSFAIVPMVLVKNFCGENLSTYIFISLCLLLSPMILLYFFRTIRLFIQESCSIFFWILYFCTIEILPIIIAIKFLGGVQ